LNAPQPQVIGQPRITYTGMSDESELRLVPIRTNDERDGASYTLIWSSGQRAYDIDGVPDPFGVGGWGCRKPRPGSRADHNRADYGEELPPQVGCHSQAEETEGRVVTGERGRHREHQRDRDAQDRRANK
jgi:hypothetical protein